MAQFFSRFWQSAKRGLFKEDNRVIGLDIGSSSVKVVQLRKAGGKAILETYGELATGGYDNRAVGQAASLSPETLTRLVGDLLREAKITARQLALAVPLRSSLLKILELPDLGEAELKRMVPLEARKYIPVPISEVTLDWSLIPTVENKAPIAASAAGPAAGPGVPAPRKTIAALMVAIHNDVLLQYQSLAQALDKEVKFFEIETFSAIRSVFTGELNPVVMVDLGAGTTKVAIIDYGVVRLSHTINKGAQDITTALARSLNVDFAKAEEIKRQVGLVERTENTTIPGTINSVMEFIFSEVNRIIVDYQRRERRAVSKIFLIGGGTLLKGIDKLAAQSFDVPVLAGNGFAKVETPAFLKDLFVEIGPPFAIAVGLALRQLQEM